MQSIAYDMKGMNDTASQNEDEETSEFKPTPECVKACHQNGKHSPHCQHNHQQFDEEVISAAAEPALKITQGSQNNARCSST